MIKIGQYDEVNVWALPGLTNQDKLVFKKRNGNLKTIIDAVCFSFDVNEEELCSRTRRHDVVVARHLAMMLARRYTTMPLVEIGKSFSKQKFDHTTVLHGIKNITNLINSDEEIRRIARGVELKIQ